MSKSTDLPNNRAVTALLYRTPMMALVIVILLMTIGMAGCSADQWKSFGRNAGENYQCQQENANRPDAAQRQAECDHRSQPGRDLRDDSTQRHGNRL